MKKILFLCWVAFQLPVGLVEASNDFIGGLRNVKGVAFVLRDTQTITAQNGLHIYQGDILQTSDDGSLGIIFNDNTRISLGSNSKLTVSQYVFKPATGKFGLLVKMAKGTASYISGKLAKFSAESVIIETPRTIIGSRGTSFLLKVD